MIWQDVVIGVGQFLFAVALVPSIMNTYDKPAKPTCSMTAAVLLVFSSTYATLSMWAAASSCLICAAGWSVLWFQKRR
jgi:hypothetical protein